MAFAIAASRSEEVIVERYHHGREVNTLLVARDDDVHLVTASDRLRPDGIGFGVALAHVYPSTLFGDALAEVERVAVAAVRAIGLRNGIAYPQLLVSPHDNEVHIIEIAARIPGGQMVEIPRYGVGIDLVEIARAPGARRAGARRARDAALPPSRRDPLPHGRRPARSRRASWSRSARSRRRSPSPASSASRPGSSRARRSGPVQTDGDRRGYVIASGDTNLEALERADAAAGLIDVLVE